MLCTCTNKRERCSSDLVCALFIALLGCIVALTGCGNGEAIQVEARSDLVTIDGMSVFGPLERSPVIFPHDKHTQAKELVKVDCDRCHPRDSVQRISFTFERLFDTDYEAVMTIYHDSCIGCHLEMGKTDGETGPLTCGECHSRIPGYVSSVLSIGFDNSLHHRHIISAKDECKECHHDYDSTKGISCRDCHKERPEEDRISMRLASHKSCVRCHLKEDSASTDCANCHSLESQQAIKVVPNPPRLKRDQPDFVLLSAPEHELGSSKLGTVPFSHVGHEEFNPTCRVCHHSGLPACNKCHGLQGGELSGSVNLQRAMHDMNSLHSCVGCHEAKKSEPKCAGCHALMEQGRLSEHACNICHAGPPPDRWGRDRNRYSSLDDFRPRPEDVRLSFSRDDIPVDVTIDILSNEYQPVKFSHRIHIDSLMKYIDESKIARYFHGEEAVVCQGCHHSSPIGKRPPLCESCHGGPFERAKLTAPGLYGAYHRQCIGCHEQMGVGKATDCAYCHKKKDLAQGGSVVQETEEQ